MLVGSMHKDVICFKWSFFFHFTDLTFSEDEVTIISKKSLNRLTMVSDFIFLVFFLTQRSVCKNRGVPRVNIARFTALNSGCQNSVNSFIFKIHIITNCEKS